MLMATAQPLCPIAFGFRRFWCACIVSFTFPGTSTAVEDDDYLSAISIEAGIVEPSSLTGVKGLEVAGRGESGSSLSVFLPCLMEIRL